MHESNSGLLLHFGWKQKFPLALFQVAQIQENSARVLIVHPLGIKTLIYGPIACNCLSIIHSSARLVELYCQVRSTVFKFGLLIARYMNHFELQFPLLLMWIIISTFLGCCKDEEQVCVYF